MNILETVWGLMNTPIGFAIVGFLILFIINKIFDAKPSWAKYEGFMISAVKFAEKAIVDDSKNVGLRRADTALKYVIEAYTQAKGKVPSKKMEEQFRLGLPVVHDKLEHMMARKEDQKKKIVA